MAGLENILMGVAYLHPIFFRRFFGRCNLLDFAVLRMRSWGSGGDEPESRRGYEIRVKKGF